jgi:ribosomal protein S18 acetylase RimI-like enzyme
VIRFGRDLARVDWQRLVGDLEADAFHNGRTPQELERSFRNSQVAVLAWSGSNVVGTARALSDGVCNAYVVDVWTQSAFRRRGIARRMMAMIEAALPGQHVYLFTTDAAPLYEALGYERDGVGFGKVVGLWLGRYPPRRPQEGE